MTAGIRAGVLFALEFLLIYRGLVWTTATRGVLFLYLAPFFVVIGSRWLVPGDLLAFAMARAVAVFAGIVIAFGLPTPAIDPHQLLGDIMFVGAGAAWAATTLIIKASALGRISSEKTLLYQLVVRCRCSRWAPSPSASHAWHTVRHRAGRLCLSDDLRGERHLRGVVRADRALLGRPAIGVHLPGPLFGVAAGHLVLNEPLTPAFALAVVLVAGGIVLVNRPR